MRFPWRRNDPPLVRHLESHLGRISGGWSLEAEDEGALSVGAWFDDVPERGARTYVTLGLSDHVLDGRRLELLFTCYSRYDTDAVSKYLATLEASIVDRHEAPPDGTVIRSGWEIFPGSSVSAVFLWHPALFPEELHVFAEPDPPTQIVMLVPLTADEVEFARTHAAGAFVEVLLEQEPDLFDLERPRLEGMHPGRMSSG